MGGIPKSSKSLDHFRIETHSDSSISSRSQHGRADAPGSRGEGRALCRHHNYKFRNDKWCAFEMKIVL